MVLSMQKHSTGRWYSIGVRKNLHLKKNHRWRARGSIARKILVRIGLLLIRFPKVTLRLHLLPVERSCWLNILMLICMLKRVPMLFHGQILFVSIQLKILLLGCPTLVLTYGLLMKQRWRLPGLIPQQDMMRFGTALLRFRLHHLSQ